MLKHHTKTKGDIGLLKVQADLATKGFVILHPLTEHAPFDLVAYNGKFYRVQVKYTSVNNGAIKVQLKSNWSDRHGLHKVPMNVGSIDLLAVYCPGTDKCYYIKPELLGKDAFTLRTQYNSGQRKGIHLAENYLDVPVA